jgi:hypothetical protein
MLLSATLAIGIHAAKKEDEPSSDEFFADTIPCFMTPWKQIENHGGSGLDLSSFLLDSLHGEGQKPVTMLSVEMYAQKTLKIHFLLGS